MLTIKATNRFLKDLKLAKRRGKDIDKLEAIINSLQNKILLADKNKDHSLTGNWKDHKECHIEPDWLLIYKIIEHYLILVRTGTHSDLFE